MFVVIFGVLLFYSQVMKKFVMYFIPVIVCLSVGFTSGELQNEALRIWYPDLVKSSLTPPPVVFPIVWGIVYVLVGLSLGFVLECASRRMVLLWVAQLFVNFAWSVLFFALRNPVAGLVDILILDFLSVWYMFVGFRICRRAAWMFVPYVLWLLFATYLNAVVVFCN